MSTSVAETDRWFPVSLTGAPRPGALSATALSAAIHRDTPPPTADDLDAWAGSAWAIELGLLDPPSGDEESSADFGVISHDVELDPASSAAGVRNDRSSACAGAGDTHPTEPRTGGASDPRDVADARLRCLEAAAVERRRHTAEEYRLIATVLSDAAIAPEPWVGPDPTLDAAWADGRRRRIAAVRRDRIDMAERAAVAEIAVRLRISEQTVRMRAHQAAVLQERCPDMWAAFAGGETSERHATETARLADSLPDDASDAWAAFDAGAAERARRLPPSRFAVAARALRERVHRESLEMRHRRAARDRGVWLTAELDGMSTLSAILPADRAHAAMTNVDRIARHLATAAEEQRTLTQLRADALADLLTSDAVAVPAGGASESEATSTESAKSGSSRPRGTAAVVVTVPALTLLGRSEEPATLDGYGPIDLDTARRLAADATSWVRLLTHPLTGAPLALDRTTYRVTTALRRWLGVTSPTCSFPGCGRPAPACDIDHLTPWSEGGTTDDDNLEPECRHHHRMRHETAWAPQRDPVTGAMSWRSPLGHEVGVDPPPF